MYYNYHARAKALIAEGHLTAWQLLDAFHGISPCLLLFFDNHKPMPIRSYRWEEYWPMIRNIREL
jgi:hypothetical protein